MESCNFQLTKLYTIHKEYPIFCTIFDIQLRAKQTAPLVNKYYESEVTLRQQNWSEQPS